MYLHGNHRTDIKLIIYADIKIKSAHLNYESSGTAGL